MIAGKESGGNYEAMYPSTTMPGMTQMTITQVINKASGAVGKYQQLPRFLARELVEQDWILTKISSVLLIRTKLFWM